MVILTGFGTEKIEEYLHILANEEVKLEIIREELVEIKTKYNEERRTEIAETDEGDLVIEDLIADEETVVVYSRSGYIKRHSVDNYRAQRGCGKGIRGMNLKEEDVVEKLFIASALSHLLIFTSLGKVHWLRVFSIPEVSRTAKGKSIANLLNLQP